MDTERIFDHNPPECRFANRLVCQLICQPIHVRHLGMATLESIYRLLDEANERLNQAVNQIRDLPLEPKGDHIYRVGKALSEVFDIQYHLFALRPDLTPQIFNGPFEHPEGALNIALRHARTAE